MAKIREALYGLRVRLFGKPAPRVAVLRLDGVIGSGGRVQRGLSLDALADDLDKAFAYPGLSAVALAVNSPGGSVVQSALIAGRIRDLARENNVPVLAFTEDIAASGGYMLALAADELFVHDASMIGSIGVIAAGFGFSRTLEKFGVERRVHTAGERKSMLDPFRPENPEDVERLDEVMGEFHEYFKAYVRERRGKRLKGTRAKIFSGEVFTGTEAVRLGLADGLGDMRGVLRERFGEEVRFKFVRRKHRSLRSMVSFERSKAAETAVGNMLDILEERAIWSRFGL